VIGRASALGKPLCTLHRQILASLDLAFGRVLVGRFSVKVIRMMALVHSWSTCLAHHSRQLG